MSRASDKRLRLRGRRGGVETFLQLPHAVMDEPKFQKLSGNAVKLLLDIARQYSGHNNGDFSAAWSLMRKRGWRSKTTLYAALDQLLDAGLLLVTRHGGLHQCSLYAITWRPIDECRGKLEVTATTKAPGTWKGVGVKQVRPRVNGSAMLSPDSGRVSPDSGPSASVGAEKRPA